MADENENLLGTQSGWATRVIAGCIIVGFLISILYSLQAASFAQFGSIAGTALAVAGAALLAGGLLGFLFGIPKKLQQDTLSASNQRADGTEQDASRSVAYQGNTNLEQISDWLTKILVGVGLTQLASLPAALQNYADYTAAGLGNFASGKVFAIALLIYFLICGFLITYLWTRWYLAGTFRQADQAAIENRISEVEKQVENNAKALSIVQRQLNPARDSQPILQEQLNSALKLASEAVTDQIYQQAYSVLIANYGDQTTKPTMERTIPVFRALIANDTEHVNYLYHAMLGFALKEKRQPDWVESEAEHTTAIEMRGPSKDYDNVWLEIQRADCRIHQDEAYLRGEPSDDKFKGVILADLKLVASSSGDKEDLTEYHSINDWITLNKIPPSDLV
jgi:hypothetical protein